MTRMPRVRMIRWRTRATMTSKIRTLSKRVVNKKKKTRAKATIKSSLHLHVCKNPWIIYSTI